MCRVEYALCFHIYVALCSVSTKLDVSVYGLYYCLILILSGDVHPNPGPNNVHQKCLSLCNMNVNSLYVRSDENPLFKLDEMYSTLCVHSKFDLICLCETWLNPSIPDMNIELPGYRLFRRDRPDGYGGVAVYVTNNIVANVLTDVFSDVVENLWLSFDIASTKVCIGTFYRPPNSNVEHVSAFIDDFNTQLSEVYKLNPGLVCITGDFNDRREAWSAIHNNSDLKNHFYDTVRLNNLSQLINVPTFVTSHSSSILDLIITDSPRLVKNCGVMSPIGTCNHSPVYCTFNLSYDIEKCYTRHVWMYKKADFNSMNDYILDIPWNYVIENDSCVDSNVNNFMNVLKDISVHFIPNKRVTVRPRDKPWMTGHIRRLLRKRDRCHKAYKRNTNPQTHELWRVARRNAKIEMQKRKTEHNNMIVSTLLDPSTSSKVFWKITKSFLGNSKSCDIPTLIDRDGKHYVTSLEKAEHLAEHFALQNTLPTINAPVLPVPYYVTESRLEMINIAPEDVFKVLVSLNTNKSVGPDTISNTVLKECAVSLSEPLCKLFNQSLEDACFPTEWKNANLSPLFKTKERFNRVNYRPISLLSCMSKCFEFCVFKQMYDYCMFNNLLSWRNSGYKRLDSTVYQLLAMVHTLYTNLDKGKDITMTFLDISKAFDRVWHEGLLFKLKSFGIEGRLLQWFKSYLQNRRQRVVIKGITSSWYTVNAGVPQGSVLGPLLFLIFINDIESCVHCHIRLFADDTHMYDIDTNINNSVARLNNDLQSLQNWACQWQVTFNPDKTVYMIFSRQKETPAHDPLTFSGVHINEVQSHKHLGVMIHNRLSWDIHVSYIIDRISNKVSIMRRFQNTLPRKCLEIIYKSMIRPVIDYSDVLFPQLPVGLCKRLENIQRQAALICTAAYKRTPQLLLLRELGWEELKTRRLFHCLIIMFKIKNGYVPKYLGDLCPPTVHTVCNYNLRNSNNVRTYQCKYTSFTKSFFPFTSRKWNEIETRARSSSTLNMFKRMLGEVLLPKPNRLFSEFHSRSAIHHTRLRLGLSALNSHRHQYDFISDSICPKCGNNSEDLAHFFFHCPLYAAHREVLFATIATITGRNHNITNMSRLQTLKNIDFLLRGDVNLSFDENVQIFQSIHLYIDDCKRFC